MSEYLFVCLFVCLFVMARQRRSGDLDQRGLFTARAIRFTLGPLLQLTELILKAFGGHAQRTEIRILLGTLYVGTLWWEIGTAYASLAYVR